MDNSSIDVSSFYLEPENDEGNHEYKYKLVNLTQEDLEGKITQLNFRLEEGNGEAIYEIGVTDNGCPLGIPQSNFDETLKNVKYMADQIDATIQIIDTNESPVSLANEENRKIYANCQGKPLSSLTKDELEAKRFVSELLIRRNNHENSYVGLRIAVAGSVDAGKSTTVGCLTQGINDNGNGQARQFVFNFKHEIDSGRTSSIAQEILGFDSEGKIVNERLRKLRAPTWPEIVKASSKICTFYDMAGHAQYFNTTIRGISGIYPDYCLIAISSSSEMAITQMTREHMIVCLMRGIPMIILFTKMDMAFEHIAKKNYDSLTKLLTGAGVNKTPYLINDKHDVVNCCHNIRSGVIVPILKISNVTGFNIDLLKFLLNCLPPRINYHEQLNKPAKYSIQDIYEVNGIGTVVSGILMSGVVSVKGSLWLGPNSNGEFRKVIVKSIHDKQTDVNNAFAGQSVCLALRNIARNQIKKGMMLIDGNETNPKGILEFEAEIEIFGRNSTSVRIGYEPVIHISNIKQAARIVKIYDVIRKIAPKVIPKKSSSSSSSSSSISSTSKDEEKDLNGDLTQTKTKTKTEIIPENDVYGNPTLRSGDKARVKFQFCFNPVYFDVNSKILFREGQTRGVGIVEKIIDLDETKKHLLSPDSNAPSSNRSHWRPNKPVPFGRRRRLKNIQTITSSKDDETPKLTEPTKTAESV